MMTTKNIKVEEIQIKVPYGIIAAKWWGPRNVRPILALHGWQDNAGSFDPLIPLLPNHLSYLAIDLPGHGLSCQLPHGMLYGYVQDMFLINFIIKQFQWDRVSFMAHSMSAATCFVYAAMFPDRVDMVIALDAIKPRVLHPRFIDLILPGLPDVHKADVRNQEGIEPHSYPYEELLNKLGVQEFLSLPRAAAAIILKRGAKTSKKDPNKYYLTRDSRLKTFQFPLYTQETSLAMAEMITCPYLFFKALDSPESDYRRYLEETLELMQRKPQFEYYYLRGGHHVHLTNPHAVANKITTFLNKYRPVINFKL